MTDEELEIRKAERKALAEVRRWKRNVLKRQLGMTWKEIESDSDKVMKRLHELWGFPLGHDDNPQTDTARSSPMNADTRAEVPVQR
jgi:hypothetical protein